MTSVKSMISRGALAPGYGLEPDAIALRLIKTTGRSCISIIKFLFTKRLCPVPSRLRRIRPTAHLEPNLLFAVALLTFAFAYSHLHADGWNTHRIHKKFYSEGASAGDIDGDGHIDIVNGPLWFRGPDFKESFRIDEPKEFPVAGYSDQFFSSLFDANGDQANDVLVIGFPGQAARLYLNP
ncbi:MAG: hypothetical protein AAF664_15130, partial [Planctomycetota bacterium]